jgi:hypothetical protein
MVTMLRSAFLSTFWNSGARIMQTRMAFRILAIGLGALHTYAAIKSQSMNADGISYLDIGDAYFRADWATAINSVWSPLYSWILGLVNFLFKPSMQWEFPTVHLVNFLIFLAALASFEFMWGNIRTTPTESGTVTIPEAHWWPLGYLLFIWTSLSLIEIWAVTPDMLMAAFVFLAAGLVAQIRSGDENSRIFLRLGLVLGLGYLSKTFMFSVALVFLGLAWLVQKRTWSSFTKTVLAAGLFLIVSLPFVLLISNVKGKLTIGEAGTITFLRYVNGMPFPHWQGNPDRGIIPTHPSRVIHEFPAVYEFGEPIGGTYPISLDPSYWYEGIEPRFDFGGLLARLLSSSLVYAELFLQKQGILVACVLALYAMRQRQRYTFFDILQHWALVIPAIIAFGLYGTVLVQSRYVGVFVVLFWADILANVRLPDTSSNKSWLNVLSSIAAIGLLANIIMFNLDGFKRLNPSLGASSVEQAAPPAKPLEVAAMLHELGIGQGEKVGVIGYAYDSFWARLLRVKIVAEMVEADAIDDLWRSDEMLLQSVLQSFAGTGAKAVVAEYVPDYAQLKDWHHVGNSNYYIYVFTEQ